MCLALAVGAAMAAKGKIGKAVMLRAESRTQPSTALQDIDSQVASLLAEANHCQWWGNGLAVIGILLGILSRLYGGIDATWYSLNTILYKLSLALLVTFVVISLLIV
jgi:hypothetical protein